ncbi:TRM11 family SAM-dependent methyltransferase [Lysinibacillus sp. 54212]|uniref:TRM11 family SAM-dependent methyltransferase n=1 Tax=Lysinibacillus sp. 54212 TaxID=3119829 RepID=UPI002FC94BA4
MIVGHYLYTYGYRHDEAELCRLEMRSFFGKDTDSNVLISDKGILPNRSPFIKERLHILFEGGSIEEICRATSQLTIYEDTFKVICLNHTVLAMEPKMSHQERREVERNIGVTIEAEPDLEHPGTLYGIVRLENRWYFGELIQGEAVWLKHQQRPQEYSTALSTKVARAIVNIAVPQIEGVRVIDPCCGIGTVLIEALSMGIYILGRDMNWFVTSGSRKNIAHFGYKGEVQLGKIEEIEGRYDVAIIDMPYNVFTHSSLESQISIVRSARRIANRAVFVTVEPLDEVITEADFQIIDRCVIRKGSFTRQVIICE